jgi:hypothetical protein
MFRKSKNHIIPTKIDAVAHTISRGHAPAESCNCTANFNNENSWINSKRHRNFRVRQFKTDLSGPVKTSIRQTTRLTDRDPIRFIMP